MKCSTLNNVLFSLLAAAAVVPVGAMTAPINTQQPAIKTDVKEVKALDIKSVADVKKIVKDTIRECIGFIDPFIILEQSEEYKDELKIVEKELAGRKQQLKSLEEAAVKKKSEIETMGNALSEAAKDRKREEFGQLEAQYRIKLQSAQEYAEKADQQARMKVLKKIQEEAVTLAKDDGRLLVMAGGVIYGETPVDLTQKVLTRLNDKYRTEKKKKEADKKPTPASA